MGRSWSSRRVLAPISAKGLRRNASVERAAGTRVIPPLTSTPATATAMVARPIFQAAPAQSR